MNKTRTVQLTFRATKDEAALIKKRIKASGLSQQNYLLYAAACRPIMNTDGLKSILPELKRIGNNLNQVARALNGRQYYDYKLITENQKELNALWQLLKQSLQKPRSIG